METQVALDGVSGEEHLAVAGQNQQEPVQCLRIQTKELNTSNSTRLEFSRQDVSHHHHHHRFLLLITVWHAVDGHYYYYYYHKVDPSLLDMYE